MESNVEGNQPLQASEPLQGVVKRAYILLTGSFFMLLVFDGGRMLVNMITSHH